MYGASGRGIDNWWIVVGTADDSDTDGGSGFVVSVVVEDVDRVDGVGAEVEAEVGTENVILRLIFGLKGRREETRGTILAERNKKFEYYILFLKHCSLIDKYSTNGGH